jgi:hypothetical protein
MTDLTRSALIPWFSDNGPFGTANRETGHEL